MQVWYSMGPLSGWRVAPNGEYPLFLANLSACLEQLIESSCLGAAMPCFCFPSHTSAATSSLSMQNVIEVLQSRARVRSRSRFRQRGAALIGLCVISSAACLAATVSPTSYRWASVAVGGKGAQKLVTLTNNGTTTITISSITLSGAYPQDYEIYSKTCGTSLAPSASCTAGIIFAPTVSGTQTATLNFNDSASPSPQTVALSGYAPSSSGGNAFVSASPTSLSWVSVPVGGGGAPKAVTLNNGGTTSISISSITLSGADPGDYEISSKTCGTSLAASASCTASIVFAPKVSGTRTATLNFNDSGTGSPQTATLSGTGTGSSGTVSISPTSLSFSSVNVGSISFAQIATLKNGSSSSITISSISVTGTDPGDFFVSSKTCGLSPAASPSCTVAIEFKPSVSGSRAGTLTVSDNSSNSPQTVSLSGTGASTSSGGVTVSPMALGFPSTAVGSTSAAQPATLTNGTKSAITISSVAIGGANAGDFTISSKTCGTSLAASANCSASVVFKPTATGMRSATLSFTDSGTGSPQTVALSGSGPAAFEIEPTTPFVVVNDTLQFSASTSVTWSATCGSITSTSGIYTAPANTGSCTVTATEIGGSATASTVAKITAKPTSGTLGIYPTTAAVYSGSTQLFQAQLSLVPDGNSLTFSVDGVVDGNGGTGTVTNGGVDTAPPGAGEHTVTA